MSYLILDNREVKKEYHVKSHFSQEARMKREVTENSKVYLMGSGIASLASAFYLNS